VALLEVSVLACGPHFPNRVLLGGDNVVLKAPVASFREEIERIKPPLPARFKAVLPPKEVILKVPAPVTSTKQARDEASGMVVIKLAVPARKNKGPGYKFRVNDPRRQTVAADVHDLEEALAGSNLGAGQRQEIINAYWAVRKALLDYGEKVSKWKYRRYRNKIPDADDLRRHRFDAPAIPEGLPVEFSEYLRGAILYHQGELEKAREVWLGLLKRPKGERPYRSTWAAFMIGKTLLEDEPPKAVEWFQLVRELAEEGFADSLGLASSSLGWEGRAFLNQGKYDEAIELYLAQMATGDRGAFVSLQWTAGAALKASPDVLEKIAKNDTARKVITAYVISRGGVYNWRFSSPLTKRWLEAVEAAEVFVEEADRLALAAYQTGEMETAGSWLDVAPPDSNTTRWVRAKLLLHDGKVAEAAEHLAFIARRFPPIRHPRRDGYAYAREPIEMRVRGELGALYLARRQYIEALDVLLRGGHWEDAAYVAERVLTPDELIEYVNLKWPPPEQDGRSFMGRRNTGPYWFGVRIRYLLARRLSRLGWWDEAWAYYPTKWQSRFDAYTQAVHDGENERLSKEERAAALWKAACIARYEGMELMGTEVEPDWFFYAGSFQRNPASLTRGSAEYAEQARLVSSSADEQQRIEQHVTEPEMRFHYRYKAIDFGWRAAELMPDDSDETARVLCIAGSWLAKLDPQAADRFYKAMVIRCGKTELGREADKLRWFPKIEIDKGQLLQ
jgi:tetratricopeptide (TPR) repeat protein